VQQIIYIPTSSSTIQSQTKTTGTGTGTKTIDDTTIIILFEMVKETTRMTLAVARLNILTKKKRKK